MPNRTVITGLGTFSGLGKTLAEFRNELRNGNTAIRKLGNLAEGTRIRTGVVINNFNPTDVFPASDIPLLDHFSQFALLAAHEAVEDAGLSRGDSSLSHAAAIIGSGCGGKLTDEEAYLNLYKEGRSRVHPLTIPKGMHSAAASLVSMDLGIHGPTFSVASACASAAHAIIQGHMMIRNGLVDTALVGGTDAPFTFGLLKAWEAMRVVSSDVCRPFSRDRSGLVLGEGAGMLLLESEQHALARNTAIYAELAGCGMTSDAGHITRPNVDGMSAAIEKALSDAQIRPESVDYINAHGTGTTANDPAETSAIRKVFGASADSLAVSSTKSMHGHALGASSALELIATVLGMQESFVPPTVNFTTPGEGCDLDYTPNIAGDRQINAAISNSFAFGGLNAVIALRTYRP